MRKSANAPRRLRRSQGTVFRVRIPFGAAHLPVDRLGATSSLSSTSVRADAFVQEAIRWLPDHAGADGTDNDVSDLLKPLGLTRGCRVLLADANADMREYVRRLLR